MSVFVSSTTEEKTDAVSILASEEIDFSSIFSFFEESPAYTPCLFSVEELLSLSTREEFPSFFLFWGKDLHVLSEVTRHDLKILFRDTIWVALYPQEEFLSSSLPVEEADLLLPYPFQNITFLHFLLCREKERKNFQKYHQECIQALDAQRVTLNHYKAAQSLLIQDKQNKSYFIKNLSSNLALPIQQLIELSEIGLRRIQRREMRRASSYMSEVKFISEELLIYIKDLQEITQLKIGESEFSPEDVDIAELLKGLQRKFNSIAEAQNVTLSYTIRTTHPYVLADYNKFFKVMSILLRNALRHVSTGGYVHFLAEERNERILFHVEDDGCGIPLHKQSRLFDMYEQNTLHDYQGIMGFGLSICKELMVGQKGNIWLDSSYPGPGTRFYLTLPIAESLLDT